MRTTALLVPLLLLGIPALSGCLEGDKADAGGTPTPTTTGAPSTGGGGKEYVVVKTNKGTFSFELIPEAAPKTVAHIKSLVQKEFYTGIPFHRYEPGFVIQGGDPNCKKSLSAGSGCGSGGSGGAVPLETSKTYKHGKGAVGLARSNDPNSGDSQWYVVLPDEGAHFLDGNYCVFGQIAQGMDVVRQLRAGDKMESVTLSSTPA